MERLMGAARAAGRWPGLGPRRSADDLSSPDLSPPLAAPLGGTRFIWKSATHYWNAYNDPNTMEAQLKIEVANRVAAAAATATGWDLFDTVPVSPIQL